MDDIMEELLAFDPATASDPDLSEMQAAARELSQGKVPRALKFFSGGEKEGAELLAHARNIFGLLSDENKAFLTYLTSSVLGCQLLTRNKMKIHIESHNFFIDNGSTGESLYDFLSVQEDNTKRILKVKINPNYDFEYYVREILSGITNDADDLKMNNSTSKFLFYNTLRVTQGKKPLKLRHSQIADDEYTLEKLQNKDWQYFIVTLLEISNEDIRFSDFENEGEHDIIDKTLNNITICKETYNTAFIKIATYFRHALEHTRTNVTSNRLKTI